MNQKSYKILSRFEICGKVMYNIMTNGSVCVMSQGEYNRIMKEERLKRERE